MRRGDGRMKVQFALAFLALGMGFSRDSAAAARGMVAAGRASRDPDHGHAPVLAIEVLDILRGI
jgi:hypothetical protein